MNDELIIFAWSVDRRGYRWVTTRPIGQPEAPEPLSDAATERERHDYERDLLNSRPRQFLTNLVPVGLPEPASDTRYPLREFAGRLHRIFAEVSPTFDGILEFANNFGLLGDIGESIPVPGVGPNGEETTAFGYGEDISRWVHEIQHVRLAATVWDWAQNEDEAALVEHFEWKQDAVVFHWKQPDIETHRVALHRQLNPAAMERVTRGDNHVPAILIVRNIVNDHLSKPGRAAPRLLHNIDHDTLEHHVVPNSLIGAIWLDFLLSVDGNKRYLRCEQCGAAFPAGGRGNKKRFCSDKCRVAAYRGRKEEQSEAAS